jgi:hypothetical protein
VNDIQLQRNVFLTSLLCMHLRPSCVIYSEIQGGITKLGCIGKDIDGVQLTTSSLFADDGVVTFTSSILATVF